MLKLQYSKLAASLLIGSLVIGTSLAPTFAQSTDRDTPTPLSTATLSGRGIQGQNQVYYYRLTAKPGKMTISLDLDAGSTNGNGVVAEINLQTPDAGEIESLSGYATPGNPSRTVKNLEFAAETPVILMLKLPGGTTAGYNYRLKIDGKWAEL